MSTRDACPDGGTCHHECTLIHGKGKPCFRVLTCGPLSGTFAGDTWPDWLRRDHRHADRVATALANDEPVPSAPSTPETVNLTTAAAMLVAMEDVGGSAADGARAVWRGLTGLEGTDALEVARDLVLASRDVTAHVAPF